MLKELVDPEKLFLEELLEGYIRWEETEAVVQKNIRKYYSKGYDISQISKHFARIQNIYRNGYIHKLRNQLENGGINWNKSRFLG